MKSDGNPEHPAPVQTVSFQPMKSRASLKTLFLSLSLLLAAGLGTTLSLRARDSKPARDSKSADESKSGPGTKPAADRPPLKLNIDLKPINRDAPDRVSYAPIVKKAAASVVFVYSSKTVRGQDLSQLFNDPMFRRFFDAPDGGGGARKKGRTPDQTQQGLGSGVVVTADGYVLTNNHIVDGADDVKVSIGESSKKFDAKVVGRDPLADLAVLKIETTGLSPATFGDSDQLQVGDGVLAIGNPFGIGQSVTRGIVSAVGRGQLGIEAFEDFIQTDAAINPGNSGGALIDCEGRVVGINTAIMTGTGSSAGVGFAIPVNLARSVAEQIVNTGRVDRGFLGVRPQDLTEDLTAQFGAEKGALITEVTEDSPAEKAGLKAGDVITKINGTEIRDARHLLLTVSQLAPGSKATVAYLRDKKSKTTEATLVRRPEQSLAGGERGSGSDVGVLNGVGVGDITPQIREQLQLPARVKGAIITSVEADCPSAKQGLREGDIILDLDRKPVKDAADAVRLSEEIKGPKVMVLIWREGRNRFLVIDESKK